MEFNKYEDLVSIVLDNSNDDEKERILEEIELIKEQKWEDYILLLTNMIPGLKENSCLLFLSAMDSYLLFKAINLKETNYELLKDQKARDFF